MLICRHPEADNDDEKDDREELSFEGIQVYFCHHIKGKKCIYCYEEKTEAIMPNVRVTHHSRLPGP